MNACRSFIVVPPIGDRYDNLSFQMRMEDELNGEFRGFKFVVTTDGSHRFDDFMLIPMLGKAGDNVTQPLAAYPDLETVETIALFLHRYLSEAPSRLN
ncbi:hypothetical protein [Mesorhizobium sp.]|uniref:hypothetical protein n=1 Tax=Mesorhizobium sp. TaxID=1871066 RepID=UPI000FE8699A|nr:hypothetical protein [Mesorhizobium sp.]RWG02588.1 MAG: hypothetical protein EOQ54_19745 [Mesorhizobium sp.]RWH03636.1 MAG: hypothetical protein EOQ72_01060 [Mesorhizobium sp.]TIN47606.1 MAG: hypothetical protein E5Y25_05300 [Mesorhizobium sp.]TIR92655.1 MAG: hypothetical protein E5X08_13405 [Mesorhizobium sp.]